MIRSYIFMVLLTAMFFIQCEKEELPDHGQEVSLEIENQLGTTIDTFQFHFNTSLGDDSLMVTQLESDQISDPAYFDNIIYRFKEKEDIFLIAKGRFLIENQNYYIANCFCDPDLKMDTFYRGSLTIAIEGIDDLRGNVEYSIEYTKP
jgi:hypothetical protein